MALPDWKRTLHGTAEHLSKQIGQPWYPYDWSVYLAKRITTALHRPSGGRLVISCPPRHGKSTLASLWLPVWYLEANPDHKIILVSYAATYAAEWGRAVRDVMLHTETWTKPREDARATDAWITPEGGGMVTTGAGGPITGRGGNLIIVDDPHKNWREAHSATKRKHLFDWFQAVVFSRKEPGATIIVIQTRWHQQDLAGWLDAVHADNWDTISLPALAEENDPMGRKPGAALCPERYDEEALRKIRAGMAPHIWSALYQQRPTPAEGSIIKPEWVRHWTPADLPETFDEQIQSWDMSFKDLDTSSYVVGQTWGRKGANAFLLDQVRRRMDFVPTVRAVQDLSAKHPEARAKLVEDKANGPAVISFLKNTIPGMIAITPHGSKVDRAYGVSPWFQAGNVYAPPLSTPWVSEWVTEITQFPSAENDDQMDATTQALDRFFGTKRVTIPDLTLPDLQQANPWGDM